MAIPAIVAGCVYYPPCAAAVGTGLAVTGLAIGQALQSAGLAHQISEGFPTPDDEPPDSGDNQDPEKAPKGIPVIPQSTDAEQQNKKDGPAAKPMRVTHHRLLNTPSVVPASEVGHEYVPYGSESAIGAPTTAFLRPVRPTDIRLGARLTPAGRARALAFIFGVANAELPGPVAEIHRRIVTTQLAHPDWDWTRIASEVEATCLADDVRWLIDRAEVLLDRRSFLPYSSGSVTPLYDQPWSFDSEVERKLKEVIQTGRALLEKKPFYLDEFNRFNLTFLSIWQDSAQTSDEFPGDETFTQKHLLGLTPMNYEHSADGQHLSLPAWIIRLAVGYGFVEVADPDRTNTLNAGELNSPWTYANHDTSHHQTNISEFSSNPGIAIFRRELNTHIYAAVLARQVAFYLDYTAAVQSLSTSTARNSRNRMSFDLVHETSIGKFTPEIMAAGFDEGVEQWGKKTYDDASVGEFKRWLENHPQTQAYNHALQQWLESLSARDRFLVNLVIESSMRHPVIDPDEETYENERLPEMEARARAAGFQRVTRNSFMRAATLLQRFDTQFNLAWAAAQFNH